MTYLIANILVLAVNLGVLALSIKLYTEILKDSSQNRRASITNRTTHPASSTAAKGDQKL